ncbi:DNA alkylation response protein [Zeimonas arvi]|uniref:DNA alkylation response protein n=2 Tax=Zeimonas arvi TaxID=2498847 RepID=A0A5C8P7B5_9BURK|nr:DNA alkylation response protein [Zeimonas arvi]
MLTHEVFNQPDPLADLDLFGSDRALAEAVGRVDPQACPALSALGRRLGAADTLDLGRQANAYPPMLRSFDRFGRRIDEVEFHPAWHALMGMLRAEGLHAATWTAADGSGFVGPGRKPVDSHLMRAAKYLLFSQVENGTQCPVTMTWAAIPLMAGQPALAQDWLPKLLSRDYDPRFRPLADRGSALLGMGMTEKQGGSDVRSNTTRAERAPASEFGDRWGEPFRLTGHKWFMSAPMCDGFLVLAQADGGGLSCFLVPRWLPDGRLNALHFQRLKDKLGNRSNASSEVEFDGTAAFLVGEIGRGIPTILEMASLTRLDCAIASAGMMRRAVAEALHHAARREAFGRPLARQPLMANVLADLALESESAMRWALRLAAMLDARACNPAADALLRIGTPLAKYWICRRGPALAFEAMEVLGGNGYVEEAPLARLYRELPVNSIWEGSGNVMCLDLLRALAREPGCAEALSAELAAALGRLPAYDRFASPLIERLEALRAGPAGPAERSETAALLDPFGARRLAGDLARAWQAAVMIGDAPAGVAAAFCAGRLDPTRAAGDQAFGTLPMEIDAAALVARAMPSSASS